MKPFIFLGVILLLLPFSLAFDCSLTYDEEYCLEILDSELNETEKDLVLSSLLYADNEFPNYEFIEDYNLDIGVDSPPDNTPIYDSVQIKNAWLSFLAVFPSVYEEDILYVPYYINVLSEYDYEVEIPTGTRPGDCRTEYQLVQNNVEVYYYLNNLLKGSGKTDSFDSNDGILTAELEINTRIEVDHYRTQTYCCEWQDWRQIQCDRYCTRCVYSHTDYEDDSIEITEEKNITQYTEEPFANLTIVNEYWNTTKGIFTAENYSYFELNFEDSYIEKQNYYYDVVFEKKPYYIAYISANNFSQTALSNIFLSNDTFFVKNTDNCSLFAYNHFYNFSSECDLTLYQENLEELSMEEGDINLTFIFYIIIFIIVIYIIYILLKSQARKIIIPIFFILLLVPFASATAEEEECGITNLASCIPEKIYDFFINLINQPILPTLSAIESLLTAEGNIDLFYHLWSIIRYILSFFYIFFFVYVGYVFLISNDNPIKRAHAKEMLKNTFLMIMLIQGSFFFYGLALDINSALSSAILTMVDPTFFLITADNIVNIGLEFMLTWTYSFILFITMLMLVLRYMIVCFGVIIFPIGLFCYFIPPLKAIGKFIISFLAIFIFVTFFDLLIIVACSYLVDIPLFENFKICVMIACFCIIIYTLWFAIKFTMRMSTNVSIKDDLNQAVKYVAMVAAV